MGKGSFVLEVPLGYLRPSLICSVLCDRIVERAYYRYIELMCFKQELFNRGTKEISHWPVWQLVDSSVIKMQGRI